MQTFKKYSWVISSTMCIVAVAFVVHGASAWIFSLIEQSAESALSIVFFEMAMICILSFVSFYLSRDKPLPSFVMALFFGIAAKPLLDPIIHHEIVLGAMVSICATLILFQGGIETAWHDFRKLFLKIALLAFPGVLLTAILFSFATTMAGTLVGILIPATVAVMLGAILASTDPAALIPLLQGLRFKDRSTKDIVVSESAMNDVVGALLTLVLIGFAKSDPFIGILDGFSRLFTSGSLLVLFQQMIFGVIAGVGGYYLLAYFSKHKKKNDFEHGADAAFFIFVPIIAFVGAFVFGGSGYLAAFIAGLVFSMVDHLHVTEHFFNHTIDGFAKPIIFLLLGALVDLKSLIAYAPVGILSAFVFILIVRPLTVFLMLLPFVLFGKNRMNVRQLLFISWVRETGAIPAVLLVTVVSLGLAHTEALLPIGMWVILLTLIIQPPLTPYIAKHLNLVEHT